MQAKSYVLSSSPKSKRLGREQCYSKPIVFNLYVSKIQRIKWLYIFQKRQALIMSKLQVLGA